MPEVALIWTDVDSSNVKRVAFHEDSKTLCVQFHGGGLYGYHDVGNDTYVELVHAESVGKYLNSVIKVMYPYTKYGDEIELLSSLG